MNPQTRQCPKCQQTMEQGFIPDYAHGGILLSSWHPGAPEKSFWKGTKASRRTVIPIGAFRCPGCGFLEFYANPEFDRK